MTKIAGANRFSRIDISMAVWQYEAMESAAVVVEAFGLGRYEVRMVGPVDAGMAYAKAVMADDPDRLLVVVPVRVAEGATVADVLAAAGLR